MTRPQHIHWVRYTRAALLLSTALHATAMAQPAPNARPTGGTVVVGQAAIGYGKNTTTVDQTTQRAAIDWQRFDVGSQQAVRFNQPNASAVVLNRVVGPDPSQIAGRISANGQVIIENQSGVTFLSGSQVNTNGLMVTAAGIGNANFAAGNMVFDRAAKPNARVSNQGTITVKGAGLAALVAPSVSNSGTIDARMGNVVLAGARAVTLDLYGDGLVSVNVTKQVTQAPDGGAALVTNTGVIRAAGGTVQLTARAADGVVQNLVSAGGTISANRSGTVSIASIGGSLEITGQVSAEGGGSVAVNATGNATVARSATISANAGVRGNGGRIAVVSGGTTTMAGTLSARGGRLGGNGGFVEVSGPSLALTGGVDVSAPRGALGTLLLDPTDLSIVAGAAGTGALDTTLGGAGQIVYGDNVGANTITNGEINALNANLVLQATNSITLQAGAPLTVSAGKSLTLQTQTGDIALNASVSGGAGSTLVLSAGGGVSQDVAAGSIAVTNLLATAANGSVSLSAIANHVGTLAGSGASFLFRDASADLTVGSVAGTSGLKTSAGNIVLSTNTTGNMILNANIDAGNAIVSLTSAQTIVQTGGTIGAGTLTGSSVGGATLKQSNAMTALGTFLDTGVGSTGIQVVDNGNLAISSVVSTLGTVSVSSAGALSIRSDGSIFAPSVVLAGNNGIALQGADVVGKTGATVDLSVANSGGVTQSAGSAIIGTTLQSSGGIAGGATLLTPGNAIGQIRGVNVTGGDFQLVSGSSLTVAGTLAASGNVYLRSSGIAIASGGSVTAGVVGLQADTFAIAAGGSVLAVTTELAPKTVGATMALGGSGSSLASLTGIGSSRVRLGAVTVPGSGLTATAGTIAVSGGNFGSGTTSLDLITQNGGAIVNTAGSVLTAATLTGSTGSLALTGANIGTLGNFTADGFSLGNSGPLSVTGSVTATNGLTLAAGAGGLALNAGHVLSGTTVDLSAAGGGITQVSSGTIIAGTLRSSGSVTGTVSLAGTGNGIGTLQSFGVTNGDFSLANTGSLSVAGTVSAGNISLRSGTIAIAGFLNAGTVLALGATSGGISETGSVHAATLVSSGTIVGGVSLTGSNTIGTIGALAYTGAFALRDTGALIVNGMLGGASAASATIGTPSLTIAAGGVINVGSVVIATTGGGVTDLGVGQIVANSVSIATSGAGDVSLTNPNNQIAASNGIQLGNGNLVLVDDPTLTLTGSFSANNLFFKVTQAGDTIALGGGGTPAALTAGSGGRISLVADNFTNDPASSISAPSGFVEIAPFSATATQSIGGSLYSHINAGTLTVGQYTDAANGNAVSLTAAGISVDGSVDLTGRVNTLVFQTSGAVNEPAGPILVGTLTGGAVSGATLAAASNAIGTLTGFTVSAGNLTLRDSTGLTLGGLVSAGTVDLSVASGGVTQAASGTMVAAALHSSGSVAGTVSLAGTGNAIGTLLDFGVTGGDFSLVNTGSLSVAGTVAAGNISLRSGTIGIPGFLNAGTVLALGATAGGVSETGSVHAVTLVGIGTIVGGIALTGSNTIGTIGALAYTGAFALRDASALTVNGTLGGISATNATIGAPGLTIAAGGVVNTGSLVIATTGGGVTDLGVGQIVANSVSIATGGAGDVSLTNPNNQIAASNGIQVGNGNLVLVDDPALTLTGTFSANNLFFKLTQAGDTIALGGGGTPAILTAGNGGRISLVADHLTNDPASSVSAPSGFVEIAPFSATATQSIGGSLYSHINAGTLTIGQYTDAANGNAVSLTAAGISVDGSVDLTGRVNTLVLRTSGAVNEPTGPILVGTLTGGAVTGVSLTTVGNTIGTLTGFTVTAGNLTLRDSTALTLGGLVSAGTVDLTTATGNLSQAAGGTLVTGLLTSAGGIAGTASLLGVANRIGTIAGLSAGGNLTVVNSQNLTLAGLVSAGTVDLTISTGGVTQAASGTLVAGTLTSSGGIAGSAVLAGATNRIGTIAGLTAGGLLQVVDSQGLTLAGLVDVATADLTTSSGGVGQAASGTLVAGMLTSNGGVAGTMSLLGIANRIGTIAGLTAGGTLQVVNSQALILAGLVRARTVDLTTSAGGVTQGAGGTLIAGVLTSSGGLAGPSALLGSANQVGVLTNVAVGGSFVLNDSVDLTVAGRIAASRIVLTDVGRIVTFANGTTLLTDGPERPFGPIQPSDMPSAAGGQGGAYVTAASVRQNGRLTVRNLNGSSNVLRLDTSVATDFDTTQGLSAPDTWLILVLNNAATASGAIEVKALDAVYPGTVGTASLFGSVNGLTGPGAAAAGHITPITADKYMLNTCPIASANCVLIAAQGVPKGNPISEIQIARLPNPNLDDDDLLVPIVSDREP